MVLYRGMAMTVSVELPIETIDSIIADELEFQYLTVKRELSAAKAGHGTNIFSTNQEKEIKELKRMAKSLRIVLGLYTVGGKYDG
jgi:hypothetical protein